MAKKDYENLSKAELIREIVALKRRKKYGLVWENKPEDVVLRCEKELPVLEEVKSLEVATDSEKPANILIEGDNYHVLSVLNYTHKGKVDVIYIDPPYNTGNKDFVYNDRYVDKDDDYRHSKWLSFMYKRLKLAKNLLKQDGALFISIDDNEYARLVMLVDEIFGEKNMKTICVKMSEATGVKMASVVKNGRIPKLKEYLIIVKKSGINNLYLEKLPKEKWDNAYKTIIINVSQKQINQAKEIRDNEDRTDNDIKICERIISDWEYKSLSDYFSKNEILKKDQEKFKYENAWRIIRTAALTGSAEDMATQEKLRDNVNFFHIITTRKKMYWIDSVSRDKVLIADDYLTAHPGDLWLDIKTTGLYNEGGINFTNGKKPLKLIEKIIKTNQCKNIQILDFFAGSGTTGEAVLKINAEDGGNRQFILCTYNEENGNGKVIDDFCYPRMKNAINGYNNREALGGNLKYYKTAFVPAQQTDRNKKKLTQKSAEMLCIRENTFEEVKNIKSYKIFRNKDRYTGIIYEESAIENFKKCAAKKDGKFSVYIFSFGDDDFSGEFMDMKKKVKVQPIPESILRAYRQIFKKGKNNES